MTVVATVVVVVAALVVVVVAAATVVEVEAPATVVVGFAVVVVVVVPTGNRAAPVALRKKRACTMYMHVMDDVTIKTPKPKCRLYWCLVEFFRLEIQSVMLVFSTGFVKHCPSNLLPCAGRDFTYMCFQRHEKAVVTLHMLVSW